MDDSWARVGALFVAAVALTATVAGASAPAPSGETASLSPPGFEQLDFDPDTTNVRVALHEDGSATWTVTYGLELRTENDTEAFRRLQDDVEANSSAYVDAFAAGITATVADAADVTGREMSAGNFSVSTDYDAIQRRGLVTYQFTWEGFASQTGERLVTGDALAGFFLSAETQLTVAWPAGYELDTVDPPGTTDEHSVTWRGASTTFDANGPRVVLVSETAGGDGLPWLPLAAAFAVLAAGLTAAGVAYRRREDDAASATAAAAATDEGAEAATEPPAELLSNEERVRRLLERRGGRVKQQEVVSELGWTAAKTSQVVNAMQEDGELEKFRLGRENVLKLPEGGEDE